MDANSAGEMEELDGSHWRLIPLTQVACLVFSGFHAGLWSPQPAKDVVGGHQATAGFIDRQRASNRPLDPG